MFVLGQSEDSHAFVLHRHLVLVFLCTRRYSHNSIDEVSPKAAVSDKVRSIFVRCSRRRRPKRVDTLGESEQGAKNKNVYLISLTQPVQKSFSLKGKTSGTPARPHALPRQRSQRSSLVFVFVADDGNDP